MPLVVLGLSHKTAPPEVRNRHAFPSERVVSALAALRDYTAVSEAAILSTCNRLEIYAEVGDFESGVVQIKNFLTTYRNMGVADFDTYLYTMLGAQAVEQLLRVASGLDSMLIGEAEILGQVREALSSAQRAHSIGPHLHRLFALALQTGKRARTETGIGRDVVSLGSAAVELAARHCAIDRSNALVIGAGKMGSIIARNLAARGVRRLFIANRTPERASALATQVGAHAADLVDVPALLREADLVISATGRGSYVVTAGDLQPERLKPLLIVDIAVPRDVEPAAGKLRYVRLYELSDLKDVIARTLQERQAEIPAVEAIVEESTAEYVRWYESRAAVPLIARLRKTAEAIRSAEIAKLFASLPELDEPERRTIEAASVSIVNRLLHEPLTRLRDSAPPDTAAIDDYVDLKSLGNQLERRLSETLKGPRRRP